MNKPDIKRLKELMEKATPGPWQPFISRPTHTYAVLDGNAKEVIQWTGFDNTDTPKKQQCANAQLIAAMFNALPALIAAYEDAERLRYLLNLNEEERAFVEATSVHIATLDENGEFNIVQGDEALAAIDAAMGDSNG